MTDLNEVLIRRRRLVYLPPASSNDRPHHPLSTVQDLFGLGYYLDKSAMIALVATSTTLATALVDHAMSLRGVAHYRPMYANFPASVEERSHTELYINATMHYLGDLMGARIMPVEFKLPRPALDINFLETLSLASPADIQQLAMDIAVQAQPFSNTDMTDVRTLAHFIQPAKIQIRENLAFLAVEVPDLHFDDQFDRATDVLRYAAAISRGDPSLAHHVKFRLTRANRRKLASLLRRILQTSKSVPEDVATHAEIWKRLVKTAHFRELGLGPTGQRFLDSVYNETNRTFSSQIQESMDLDEIDTILDLYHHRPGVFARSLAELLRRFPTHRQKIINAFTKVAPSVSQRVLVQMWNLFSLPDRKKLSQRSYAGKSRSGNVRFLENRLDGDYSDVLDAVRAGLRGRNAHLKVLVNPDDANSCAVPLSNRSASPGMRVFAKGSRIRLDSDSRAIRFFMHWRNIGPFMVDLDLSAFFVDEKHERTKQIAYYRLTDRGIRAFHSGDITSAPRGAAEFLDVDVQRVLDAGYRYVVMTVNSYSGSPFCKIPDAWAGAMERCDVNSGEIFEPSTVSFRYSLTSQAKMSVPLVCDLQTREVIWLDAHVAKGSTLRENLSEVRVLMAEALSRRMTVAELLKLTSAKVGEPTDPDVLRLDATDVAQVLGLMNT